MFASGERCPNQDTRTRSPKAKALARTATIAGPRPERLPIWDDNAHVGLVLLSRLLLIFSQVRRTGFRAKPRRLRHEEGAFMQRGRKVGSVLRLPRSR